MKHDFGGDFSFAQDLGHFLDGQVVGIMKAQDGIGICGKSILGQLPKRTEGHGFVFRGFLRRVVREKNFRFTVPSANFIERETAGNGEKPGKERAVVIVLLDLAISSQERFLGNVIGGTVGKVAEDKPPDSAPMPADQLIKGVDLPGLGEGRKFFVRLGRVVGDGSLAYGRGNQRDCCLQGLGQSVTTLS